MASRLRPRRDTLTNWSAINPILADGELVIELSTPRKFKIGDGVTHYNDLPYASKGDPGLQGPPGSPASFSELLATSLTSITVGTGSKTFTVEPGKSFVPGMPVTVAATAAPTNSMSTNVTSYSGTTLVLEVSSITGSGTFADWQLFFSGSSSVTLDGGVFTSTNTYVGPTEPTDPEVLYWFNTAIDTTPPVISAFTLPASSSGLVINITSLSSSDTDIASWAITEVNSSAGASWGAKPTQIVAAGTGLRTFYAWAKDYSGNISAAVSAQCTVTVVDTTAPGVTAFQVGTVTYLTVQISSFTATDNVGVVGYLITESSTQPASGDSGWASTAPINYTSASAGSKTLYPWVKDAAGNVSPLFGTPRAVTFVAGDSTPDQFTFVDQAAVEWSAVIESAPIVISGLQVAAQITITGGEYSINGGAYTSANGTISNGNSLKVRHTSGASNLAVTSTVVTIGGVSDTWTSTTRCHYATTGLILDVEGAKADGSGPPINSPVTMPWQDLTANNLDINFTGYTGNPSWLGNGGQADPYRFTLVGADSYASIDRAAIIEPSNISIEIPLMLNLVPASQNSPIAGIVMKYKAYTDYAGYGLFIQPGGTSYLIWRLAANGAVWRDVAFNITAWAASTLYFITVTYDGRYSRMYVDGTQVASIDLGAGGPYNIIHDLAANSKLTVGAMWEGSSKSMHLRAQIPLIRIYNRALSATEVSENYQSRYRIN